MEILERYLQAVRRYLPWQRQDDIIAELRANMESQMEDAAEERGRPLNQAEVEEMLKKMGSPILIAARYQPQRSLIGPAIFPVYLYVLRMAALWAAIVYTVAMVIVVPLVTTQPVSAVRSLLMLPVVLFYTAGWVTLVFSAIEFFGARNAGKLPAFAGLDGAWDPASLPPLEKTAQSKGKQRNLAHAIAEVVFGFLVLCWLALIPRFPILLLGPGVFALNASPFVLSSAWWAFYWLILALNLVQVFWRLTSLLRGTWREPLRIRQLVFKVMGIVPLVWMLAVPGSSYVLLRHPDLDAAHYGGTLDTINKSVPLGLMVVCAIVSLQLLWDIAQIVLEVRRKSAARSI